MPSRFAGRRCPRPFQSPSLRTIHVDAAPPIRSWFEVTLTEEALRADGGITPKPQQCGQGSRKRSDGLRRILFRAARRRRTNTTSPDVTLGPASLWVGPSSHPACQGRFSAPPAAPLGAKSPARSFRAGLINPIPNTMPARVARSRHIHTHWQSGGECRFPWCTFRLRPWRLEWCRTLSGTRPGGLPWARSSAPSSRSRAG